ncbi:MAG: type II toxin-antitoxin system HicA family toxin [Luteimonas sp.]|jgi:mRNA interferase HicA
MKQSEFRRWLSNHGAVFKEGKRHLKVYLNGRQCVMPRHPSHEISEKLRRAILRQLRLE